MTARARRRVSSADELKAAWDGFGGAACVLEALLDFSMEISVIGVRSQDGRMTCYDCPENGHAGGILRTRPFPPVARKSIRRSPRTWRRASRRLSAIAVCWALNSS